MLWESECANDAWRRSEGEVLRALLRNILRDLIEQIPVYTVFARIDIDVADSIITPVEVVLQTETYEVLHRTEIHCEVEDSRFGIAESAVVAIGQSRRRVGNGVVRIALRDDIGIAILLEVADRRG